MDSSPSRVSELSFSSVWSLNVDKVCSDNTQHEQIVVSSEHSFAKVHSRTLSVGVCSFTCCGSGGPNTSAVSELWVEFTELPKGKRVALLGCNSYLVYGSLITPVMIRGQTRQCLMGCGWLYILLSMILVINK